MKIELITKITALRKAVSFLGEKKKWWNTQFQESSSKEFLAYIFPKSKNTQLTSANKATQHLIDMQVGANYYHLFRLPLSMEEMIYEQERNVQIESFISEEEALTLLDKIALGLSASNTSGPINIGSSDQINDDIIQAFAAEYLNAFNNDYITHPYLY